MSMVSFMPWCSIEKTYDVAEIKIIPFRRQRPIEGLDTAAKCCVNTILSIYKTIEGKPIDSAAIVRYGEKSLIDDLGEEERGILHELVTLACFCALVKREYFNPIGPYCNSECFDIYIQKFDTVDFIALTTRRREGQTLSGWPIEDIAITIPVHCHPFRGVRLDEALLKALTAHRKQSKNEEWVRWQNAISCFNQANTDDEKVPYQVEWVLLSSAFEHLLAAKSEAKDVASKFSENLVPKQELMAQNANRRSDRWTEDGRSLRYEWMREFYRIRGDFAHGKLSTQQATVWNPLEHLVLATIAFPLVVKCLLKKVYAYDLTGNDRAQVYSFEALADTKEFLRPPPGQKNSLDSHWKRLCNGQRWKLAAEEAWEDCKAKGLLPEELEQDASSEDDSAGKST